MPSCSNPALFLGCQSHCKAIGSFTSDQTGVHIVTYEFGSSIKEIQVLAIKGKPFYIENSFNETAKICFSIKKPNCENLIINEDGIDYDRFSFQNKI